MVRFRYHRHGSVDRHATCAFPNNVCVNFGYIHHSKAQSLHDIMHICYTSTCETEQVGYVLRDGETQPPVGLTAGVQVGRMFFD